LFWRKNDADIHWKMLVYNAVIISQITYGLNTLNITPGIKNRLNSFHMRGLRYMLGIDHSYYSHETNDSVLEKANLVLNKAQNPNLSWQQFRQQQDDDGQEIKTIRLVGDIILDRQKTLLGHLLRRDDSDLMRHVAFDDELKRPHQLYKKTGHPRASWVDDNLERVYSNIFNDAWDQTDPIKRQDLINAAMEYKF